MMKMEKEWQVQKMGNQLHRRPHPWKLYIDGLYPYEGICSLCEYPSSQEKHNELSVVVFCLNYIYMALGLDSTDSQRHEEKNNLVADKIILEEKKKKRE